MKETNKTLHIKAHRENNNLFDVQGISPIINTINALQNNDLFLKATLYSDDNTKHTLYVLPDGGNRAKCIMRDDVFFSMFPNRELEPSHDEVTTAVRGGGIKILGTPKDQIEFLFANQRYFYRTKPLIVKDFILPCLLSATDLKNMKAKIDYGRNTVSLGTKGIQAKLEKLEHKEESEICTVQKCTVYPGTEKVIPIKTQDALGKGEEMLFLPDEAFDGLCIASVNPVRNSGLAYTKIINWTDHPITIKAGQKIGTGLIAAVQMAEQQKPVEQKRYLNKTKPQFLHELRSDLKIEENKYLSGKEKNELLNLLYKYKEVIAQSSSDIGTCTEVKCHIATEPGKTVKANPRPLPPHLKENLQKQLDAWLASGVISPAPPDCPFSSPMVPVKKKNGEIRWAVDYRALNNITTKDHRPIPNVFEKLSSLKTTTRKPLRYFGSIDLIQAFNHIEVDDESKVKTAITTPQGLWIFNKMPFGVATGPQTFSELIRILEQRLKKQTKLASQILVYFDDALLCASSWSEFLEVLEAFLNVCQNMNLKINPKKCSFGLPSMKWLGHELSDQGIQPADDLTETIKNWPKPQNVGDLRSLFGTFSYYRRFISNFAERTEKMRKLLLKDTPFEWTQEHTREMQDLQKALTSKPILAHPDFSANSKPFIVYVDSSKTGVGAVLMQEQDVHSSGGTPKKMEVVIAYASKALNQAEQHYSAYKKELLGVVYALNHFRYFLLGKKFLICTDHKGLEWLMTTRAKGNVAMIYRWQDVLAEFDFDIKYVCATKMKHVDGLSRRTFHKNDLGNICDLPEFNRAQHSISDDFWIPQIKAKAINAIDRPKRQRVLPARLRDPDIEINLPPSLLQGTSMPQPLAEPTTTPEEDNNPQPLAEEMSDVTQPHADQVTDDDVIHFDDVIDFDEHDEPGPSGNLEEEPILPVTTSRRDEIRAAQQSDGLLKVIYMYVHRRPHNSDFNLKNELTRLKLPPRIFNTIIRKRNKFFLSHDDVLHVKGHDDNDAIVLPSAMHAEALQMAHDHEGSLHPGVDRTMKILKPRIWWPEMQTEVENYIRTCSTCRKKDRHPAQNVPTLGRTTSRLLPKAKVWSADFLAFNKPSGRHTCVLTMMDYDTRWVEAYKLPNEQAGQIVKALRRDFVPRYGYGIGITTDRGKPFLSKLFESVCLELHYIHDPTLPYSPQANPVERAHRSLNENLRILLEDLPETAWGTEVDKALWTYRSLPTTNGPSPYELMFGVEPFLPIDAFLGRLNLTSPVAGATLSSPPTDGNIQSSVQAIMPHPDRKVVFRDDPINQDRKVVFRSENHSTKTPQQKKDNTDDLLKNPKFARLWARLESKLQQKKIARRLAHIKPKGTEGKICNINKREDVCKKIELRHQQNQRQKEKRYGKSQNDKPGPVIFRKDDKVLLWRPLDFKDITRGRKYTRHWSGPYKVVHHDWEKPFRVFISDMENTWTKDVHINHIKHQGHVSAPCTAWSPFAPPLTRRMIRSGHNPTWINQEREANKKIQDRQLEQANAPPLITGQWDDDQTITKEYQKIYPSGFHQGKDLPRQQTPEPEHQDNSDTDMPLDPLAVWREKTPSSRLSSPETSDSSNNNSSDSSSSPDSSSSDSESDSESDTNMKTPPKKGVKRARSVPTSASKVTPSPKKTKN